MTSTERKVDAITQRAALEAVAAAAGMTVEELERHVVVIGNGPQPQLVTAADFDKMVDGMAQVYKHPRPRAVHNAGVRTRRRARKQKGRKPATVVLDSVSSVPTPPRPLKARHRELARLKRQAKQKKLAQVAPVQHGQP